MIDVPMIDSVGDMIQLAIMACDQPPKAIAMELQCSASHLYGAMQDLRSLPKKARQQFSSKNLIAAAAVAMESTGFDWLFGYQKVDRHIQSMILRLKKQDKEVMIIMSDLPFMLLDKNCGADLTEEEQLVLKEVVIKLSARSNSTLNLMQELEVKYGLKVNDYMQEKSPVLTHRRFTS